MDMLEYTKEDKQYYPTPESVAKKMLNGVDWNLIHTVLEPSAGKGNLVEAVLSERPERTRGYINISCIEIDAGLRSILKYNYGGERTRDYQIRLDELDEIPPETRTQAQNLEYRELTKLVRESERTNVRIIHDNFLTFDSYTSYDLVIMNPPFSEGDKHLLKALEVQKNGGAIICLLNTETITNQHTNTRKLLSRQLKEYNAEIEIIKNAFEGAERAARVDVAIIRIVVPPKKENHSMIWERMEKAVRLEQQEKQSTSELIIADDILQAAQQYDVEVRATLELIREYNAFCPYMLKSLNTENINSGYALLSLVVNDNHNHYNDLDINQYLREVRLKYWNELFNKPKVTGRLTSNLLEKYRSNIDRLSEYDVTAFNIKAVLDEMTASFDTGVKDAILSLFDKLTAQHSWWPETQQNIHYYNGWAANKAHKIGKKSIIPTYRLFSDNTWSKRKLRVQTAYSVLSDIEKVFNYLDDNMTDEIDLLSRLQTAADNNQYRNIECKYFKVDLYKKGTTHIKYTNMELIEKLNIFAGRGRNWLPPNYGKKHYAEMTAEEKEIIDNFQGEKEYARVMSKRNYYLVEPTVISGMLTGGVEQA